MGTGGLSSGLKSKGERVLAGSEIRDAAKTWKPEINFKKEKEKIKKMSPTARSEYIRKLEVAVQDKEVKRKEFAEDTKIRLEREIDKKYPPSLAQASSEAIKGRDLTSKVYQAMNQAVHKAGKIGRRDLNLVTKLKYSKYNE
ncbi:MAG: hypothetical protein IJQ63_04565 [Synergistaceae bacterium]|nr:hypothetical protein [Synergistaceae bacterium]